MPLDYEQEEISQFPFSAASAPFPSASSLDTIASLDRLDADYVTPEAFAATAKTVENQENLERIIMETFKKNLVKAVEVIPDTSTNEEDDSSNNKNSSKKKSSFRFGKFFPRKKKTGNKCEEKSISTS